MARRVSHFYPQKRPGNKYGAKRTTLDGITFDSKREAARYADLKLMQKAGLITDLKLQPKFRMIVEGDLICDYVADFAYTDEHGREVVEDVKSEPTKTAAYRIKKKLLKAIYGISVTEVE